MKDQFHSENRPSSLPFKMGQMAYSFHPFELAFSGFSGTGKTSLIEKIVRHLGEFYRIGYVKHDAHRFNMDQKGKDTSKLWEAGAHQVFINDPHHQAHIVREATCIGPGSFASCDFVLIEGWKRSLLPKILVLDPNQKIWDELGPEDLQTVVAAVGASDCCDLPIDVPYFQRDQLSQIINFICNRWINEAQRRPLYGLILAGGHSRRMGQDKALLEYQGRPQLLRLIQEMKSTCDQIFISCRADQQHHQSILNTEAQQIFDRYLDMGPLGGILSAFHEHPEAAFMLVACDLPFVQSEVLFQLKQDRDIFKLATCFESESEPGKPEPLCSIYEPRSRLALMEGLALGYQGLRRNLAGKNLKMIKQRHVYALLNTNSPAEYMAAVELMKSIEGTP